MFEVIDAAYLIFPINSITSTNCRTTRCATRSIVSPIGTTLSVRTISRHVSSIATDSANDVRCEVALFRAVILPMTNLTTYLRLSWHTSLESKERLTILACLVFVVTKGSIESCKLTKLVTFELILSFRDRSGLATFSTPSAPWGVWKTCRLDDIVDQLLRFVDLFFGICHDQAVQVFFLVAGVSCVRTTLSFFH